MKIPGKLFRIAKVPTAFIITVVTLSTTAQPVPSLPRLCPISKKIVDTLEDPMRMDTLYL